MGLAMKQHIATGRSVNWVSDNGTVYCFGDEEAKKESLSYRKAQIVWSRRLGREAVTAFKVPPARSALQEPVGLRGS